MARKDDMTTTSTRRMLPAMMLGALAYAAEVTPKPWTNPNAIDERGNSALMNAVLFGSADDVRNLLARGADPNLANAAGATALIWGAGDPEKARLLIEKGADVNARSKSGRTPLLAAAAVAGNSRTVKMLLDRGAKADQRDEIPSIPVIWTGGGKATPLIEASRIGDVETIRLLLAAGAAVKATDSHGGTALGEAAFYGRVDVVRMLIDRGADVNAAAGTGVPVLSMAAARSETEVARILLRHGARVSQADAGGNTPLMFAAMNETPNTELLSVLLAAGADPNHANKAGEAALDWALRRGETAAVARLRQAGARASAKPAAPAAVGAEGAFDPAVTMKLLAASARTSFKTTGCISCHNHALPLQALASTPGLEGSREEILKQIKAFVMPTVPSILEGSNAFPDIAQTGSYILEAFAAHGYPADIMTAAIVHKIATNQAADGRWHGIQPRPPLQSGDFQATAMAIRSLSQYGQAMPGRKAEFARQIRRGPRLAGSVQACDARGSRDAAARALLVRRGGA
ncbi:MAG: hypothetical protein FJW39_17830 [Acidobacteria bacterium]|nr:hypothetical protein [Acidobacteriota bacterium]